VTDEEVLAFEEAREKFHACRKHNTPRPERQRLWREYTNMLEAITIRMERQHPRSPSKQWLATNVDPVMARGSRWTYARLRSLLPDEVDAIGFGDALGLYDVQCDDLHDRSRFVVDAHVHPERLTLRLSVPLRSWGDTLHTGVVWEPDMRVWRRYAKSVGSHPRRDDRGFATPPEIGMCRRVTRNAIWYVFASTAPFSMLQKWL
jgi:hypothetical protein